MDPRWGPSSQSWLLRPPVSRYCSSTDRSATALPSDRGKVPRRLSMPPDAPAQHAPAAALGIELAKTEQLKPAGMGSLHVLLTWSGVPLSSTMLTWTAIVRVLGLPMTH